MPEGSSPTRTLLRTLKKFPLYLYVYVVSLLIHVTDDFLFTTLLFAGVASGLAFSSVAAGFAVFFILFVAMRLVNHLGDSNVAAARVANGPPPFTVEETGREI